MKFTLPKPGHCNNCGSPFSTSNTHTKEGWLETEITGLCEDCFDTMLAEESDTEETIEILTQYKNDSTQIDSDIVKLIDSYSGKLFLAGGCWRKPFDGIQIDDYDIFFSTLGILELPNVISHLEDIGFNKVFECPLGELYTFKDGDTKVQLITKFRYESMEDLISTFDITAACCGYDGTQFHFDEMFRQDCENKEIGLNRVTFPVATMKRINKYRDKGYMVPNTTLEHLVQEIVRISGGDMSLIDNRFYID